MKPKKQQGFTLIELVVVIAILGILAGLALPHLADMQAEARDAKAKSNIIILQKAYELVSIEVGVPPTGGWVQSKSGSSDIYSTKMKDIVGSSLFYDINETKNVVTIRYYPGTKKTQYYDYIVGAAFITKNGGIPGDPIKI
ncbi:MAG: type II secretion system protein [Acidaminococcaceae bacterium]